MLYVVNPRFYTAHILSLGVFALGIVLLIFGLGETPLAARPAAGAGLPSAWLAVLGLAAVCVGLTLALRSVRK